MTERGLDRFASGPASHVSRHTEEQRQQEPHEIDLGAGRQQHDRDRAQQGHHPCPAQLHERQMQIMSVMGDPAHRSARHTEHEEEVRKQRGRGSYPRSGSSSPTSLTSAVSDTRPRWRAAPRTRRAPSWSLRAWFPRPRSMRPPQPKSMPSSGADGVRSGRRIMRNELARPRRPASSGIGRATWSERFRASSLIVQDLRLPPRAVRRDQRVELGVAHDLGVVLEHRGDLLLLVGGDDRAVLGHVGEAERERGEHDAAGHGEAEREPERPGRGVHARGLADPLLLDRGERVVVELGDEQAEAAAGDDQRDRRGTTRCDPGNERDDEPRSRRPVSTNPARMMRGRSPVAGPLPGEHGERRTWSATAAPATGQPAWRCTRGSSAGTAAGRSWRRPG